MGARRQERKVVTVLFCDLVGFTQQAEELDPEDVAALLGPYHARVKDELERHGGTVEKFIGDAVMALFGAPLAHEDDPERAVRAALAIRDFAERDGIELRIGVTTGEALIAADARPEAGETMATGDVVNTAARLQAAAPVNGILVSESTRAATRDVVTYEPAEAVEAKGKSRPVPTWRAVAASPVVEPAHTTPLVGRAGELELLSAALDRAREDRATQLLTLVGVPGIGKSRLVHELTRGDTGFAWRKGRCLPYGEGVTFWALGEVVKAQLGILESDSPREAEQKLCEAVEDTWIADNLRPLVGLADAREVESDRRAEAFAAWRAFLAGLASAQPLALVLEDVHWADDALLDFVNHLVEWAPESPLLVVCTARPELLERRPGWGANEPRALTVAVDPLSDGETAELFTSLVEGRAGEELLARAAGNPLYAEQYARLVSEGGSLDVLPPTVHGIITARLDALPADEKALVRDASVVGAVFWSGTVAALSSDDRWSVEEQLLALERRAVVRRERESSVEGETQYSFMHLLLRDVAYSQIPRADRAERHRRAADWIEALGRPEDHSEMLAHHFVSALEYATAAGLDTVELAPRARVALRDAGDRALALDAYDTAAQFYGRAAELWPADDPEQPLVLFRHVRALSLLGVRVDVLEQARDALLAKGYVDEAAEAEAMLGVAAGDEGRPSAATRHYDRAAELIEGRTASPAIADVLDRLARFRMAGGEWEQGVVLARRSVAMAADLGSERQMAGSLNTLGVLRVYQGDSRGVEDLARSIEILERQRSFALVRAYGNLGAVVWAQGDARRARELSGKAHEVAQHFGWPRAVRTSRVNLASSMHELGEWDDAVELFDHLLSEFEAGSPHGFESLVRVLRADVRLARGDVAGAIVDAETAVERSGELQMSREDVLTRASLVFLEAQLTDRAHATIGGPDRSAPSWYAIVMSELGRADEAREVLERDARATLWLEAAVAYLDGDLVSAAGVLTRIGDLPAEAYVRLRAAERFIAEGRQDEAQAQLERSLAFWRSVGATRYIGRAEQLLER